MKILVTGGGGFLGRYIVEQLIDRGDQVTVFARSRYPELESLGATTVQGDITDKKAVTAACQDKEVVFHVAAQPGIWGTWESFYNPNFLGTRYIIEACQTHDVKKLVYTSSPSVVFGNEPQEGVNETIPYPEIYENFYSQTKAMAEKLVIEANSSTLLTVSLRPHLIWGPRDNHLLPRLIARAKSKKLIQVGAGENKVDMTYVEDAARAHLLAEAALGIGSSVAGSVYFISQDDPVNLWGWINAFLAKLDLPPIKKQISVSTARRIGHTMEFFYRLLNLPGEPRMTRFLASELAKSHYFDISKARADFNYTPQFTNAHALEKTIAYYQKTIN